MWVKFGRLTVGRPTRCLNRERLSKVSPASHCGIEVEAIKVHDLIPSCHEVPDKLLLRIVTSVDFRDSSKLRVRTENEIDGSGGPLHFACLAVPSFEEVIADIRHTIDHRADCCPNCGGRLKRCEETRTRYTEDIPDIQPEVTEHPTTILRNGRFAQQLFYAKTATATAANMAPIAKPF